ncbi:GMC family oxidoreductase, partial [Serratia marcescens]|uniref:GMC family oxidoreductase n=1 Tax=Serratia marcescens TaxID=615 RepID=UPI003EC5F02A
MNKSYFDVVIVGSGAAGCVVADYLATNTQASIAVLEAGKTDLDPMIHIPAGYSEILAKDKHVWLYETVPQHGHVQKFRMGKVVGGGTSINAMCYVRGQKRDFDTWQQSVNDEEWSYDSLWKTFVEQENNDTFHNKNHGISGNLSVQLPHGINKLNQYCMKAFQEFGLPYNPDYNGDSQFGVSPVQSNIGDQKRCSAVVAHLQRHIDSERVVVLTNHTVTKILFDGDDANGVEVDVQGKMKVISAGLVILSAGAVQSPKILMHSGIGPKEELNKFSIPVKVDLPGVGNNLQDHPVVTVSAYVKGKLGYQQSAVGFGMINTGIKYIISKDGPAAGNGLESVSYWNPVGGGTDPTVQCYHEPIISTNRLSPTGTRSGITFALIVLQPRSKGWVRLADNDPLSMPLINPNFMMEEYDINTAVQAVKDIRKVMKQQSLCDLIEEEVMPGSNIKSDEQIADFVKEGANKQVISSQADSLI